MKEKEKPVKVRDKAKENDKNPNHLEDFNSVLKRAVISPPVKRRQT